MKQDAYVYVTYEEFQTRASIKLNSDGKLRHTDSGQVVECICQEPGTDTLNCQLEDGSFVEVASRLTRAFYVHFER